MASGTQNLSPQNYTKIQNNQITVNGVVGIILLVTYYIVKNLLLYKY